MALSELNRQRLAEVNISTLSTCLFRLGVRSTVPSGIVALTRQQPRMVGPAFTLRFVPMRDDRGGQASYGTDSNVHQQAFEQCPPGSVLVLDTRGETRGCSCGDLLIGRLKARGCAGIVTDGGFRDTAQIEMLGFPAYQRCAVPAPSFGFLQAVEMNTPVGCSDVAVYPGDIIVGDAEGVVVIPLAIADQVAEQGYEQTQYEKYAASEVASGRSIIGLYPSTPTSREQYRLWLGDRVDG